MYDSRRGLAISYENKSLQNLCFNNHNLDVTTVKRDELGSLRYAVGVVYTLPQVRQEVAAALRERGSLAEIRSFQA